MLKTKGATMNNKLFRVVTPREWGLIVDARLKKKADKIPDRMVLNVTIKKKWFDMIYSGEKKEEYREIKPFWESRLLDRSKTSLNDEYTGKYSFKKYTHIRFFNGRDFQETNPNFTAEIICIRIGKPFRRWCEESDIGHLRFIICIGNIEKGEQHE